MTARFRRIFVGTTATVACCLWFAGCDGTTGPLSGVFVADAGDDAATLPDADTADVAADTAVVADAGAEVAADASADAGTDAIAPVDAQDDTAPDAAAPDADAAAPADVTDVVVDVAEPDTTAPDSVDAADAAPAKCASAADCGGDTPYCSPAGACVACNFNVQCPGDGAFCVNHACSTAVNCTSDKDCTPLGAVCDTAKGVCRECLSAKDCGAGQACKANQCATLTPCQSSKECPGALVCSGGQCVECAADTDCLGSQFCGLNLCTQDVCKPGAHCALNAIATCKANGSGWDYTDCGSAGICLGDKCEPVVCTPDAITCQNGQIATCNSTGTTLALSKCPGTQTCAGTACTDVICAAKATQCDDKGALQTCSDDGTQWLTAPCASGFACAAGACVAQICTPGAMTCDGQKLMKCVSFGLAWGVFATCSDTAQVCVVDKCADKICAPNTLKCDGNALTMCNADGMGWTPSSCDDSNGCTNDGCDPIAVQCVHPAINCDDGNICTVDSCSGGCIHAPMSGAICDDGNACTTGEVCIGGSCTAPVSSVNVSTIAGSGATGSTNGPGSSATFNEPFGLTRMPDGSFAVADYAGNRIRQVQADGTVSTLAGSGTAGSTDGPVGTATFSGPNSVAVDAAGSVFVADYITGRIRIITGGVVGTFAGGIVGYLDGVGTAAQFNAVRDIKFDSKGILWAADRGNQRIRRIAPDGTVTTAAGNGTSGYLDGPAASAQFADPCRVAPAADGSVYIADCSNYRIRKLSADGTKVTTVAGAGIGFIDGAGSSAKFGSIGGMSWLGSTLLVTDNGNNRIRAVAGDGSVSTLAGSGSAAYIDGAPSSASFSGPGNLAPDWSGMVWIADSKNQRIRKLSFANLLCNDANPCTTDSCSGTGCTFTPIPAGSACTDGSACTANDACSVAGKCTGTAAVCSDGNPCTADACNPGTGVCLFSALAGPCNDNNVCTVGDQCVNGACVAGKDALVTVAGTGAAGYVDGPGNTAQFNATFGLALTNSGGAYVSESNGNRIRYVAADGTTSTAAGTGTAGYLDGAASTAQFNFPTRMTLDSQGAVLIADGGNNRIRKLSGQTVSTVAGSGTAGFLDGSATSAQFNNPLGIVYNPANGVTYVADSGNHRVRAIAANGTVSTFAGSGVAGYVDGTLLGASFSSPRGICLAPNGTIYVVDTNGNNVRKLSGGQVVTFAGGGPGADDGIGTAAGFNAPRDCTVDPSGNVWLTDTESNRLRRITPTGVVTTVAGSTMGNGATLAPTDGPALTSVLAYPAIPAWSSGGTIWLADGNTVRKFIQANLDCGDGQPCTIDVCNGTTGACSHAATPNGGACDDGKLCVVNEWCQNSACTGGTANLCDDGDKCTIDSCNATTGCQHVASTSLPGCCNPTVFATGFENDGGNGITLSQAAATTMGWSIGTQSKAHTGSGALAITALNSDGTATATLPSILLPAGTSTLSFWLYYDAVPSICDTTFGQACGTATFKVLVNGVQVSAQATATTGWTQVTISSSLVGGSAPSVQLIFATTASTSFFTYDYASAGSGVFVDDIEVTSSCP